LSWATVTATHTYNKPHRIYTIDKTSIDNTLDREKTVHNTVRIKSVQLGNSHLLLFSIIAAGMNEFLYL